MNTLTQDETKALSPTAIGVHDALALIGRLLLAALFILAGFGKIGAAQGTIGYIASVGIPFAEAVYYATIALEIGGGILLAIGFKTRIVAVALAAFSIASAVLFHADFSDQMQFTSFFKNLAIAGGMLQVIAFGAGRFAISRD